MKKGTMYRYCTNFLASRNEAFLIRKLENLLLDYPVLEYETCWDCYGLIYLEKGDGSIVVDNVVIRTDEPKAIFIKPGQVTLFDISRQTRGVLVCFKEDFFSLRYNNNVLFAFAFMQNGVRPFQRLTAEIEQKLSTILFFMLDEFAAAKAHTTKVLRSYLNIILFELQYMFQKLKLEISTVFLNEKVIAFENLVNKHFANQRLPSFYAKALCVTENYLNKLCKRCKDKTAGEIIRERVSIEAQRLLHHTQHSVAEIAHELGFETPSYFTTFFKKQVGHTPEAFRDMHKK